jgi:hypothetical protein
MIEIRHAEEAHISALAEIERAAAELFSELDLPPHLRNETVSEQEQEKGFDPQRRVAMRKIL